jgi:acyl carrier protein
MNRQRQVSRTEIASLVLSSLRGMLSKKDGPPPDGMGESTSLIGRGSLLDSLGLVTLIVDLEQRLEDEYGISLTLADERAMSQKNSPFRTVRSLADYVCLLIAEVQQDDRP